MTESTPIDDRQLRVPGYLRNAHLQTVLNSQGPRKWRARGILRRLDSQSLVLVAEDIGLSAEPEEGTQAKQAAVHDAADDAVKRAISAQKAALKKANKLSEKTAQCQEKEVGEKADKELEKLEKETVEAEKKAAKAAVKAKDALQETEKLNGPDKKGNL